MPEGAFNSSFDPVVRAGGVLNFNGIDSGDLYVVQNINVLPGITLDEDFSVPDGQQEKQEITELEMDDGFLGQFRLLSLAEELPDDVEIKIDHGGKQSPMYETKNRRGFLDNTTGAVYTDDGAGSAVSDHQMSRFSELFVWEDSTPYFTVENNSGAQVDFNLTFTGYAYSTEPVSRQEAESMGIQPVSVPIESLDR